MKKSILLSLLVLQGGSLLAMDANRVKLEGEALTFFNDVNRNSNKVDAAYANEMLTKYPALVTAQTKGGTALFAMVCNGKNADLVEVFLRHGADPDELTTNRGTPARDQVNNRSVRLVIEAHDKDVLEARRALDFEKEEARLQAEREEEEALRVEAARVEAERQAAEEEAARVQAEREAEEARRAEEARLEADRQAAEEEAARVQAEREAEEARRAEEARLEAERQAEAVAREQAERREAARIANIARLEALRIEAELKRELFSQDPVVEQDRFEHLIAEHVNLLELRDSANRDNTFLHHLAEFSHERPLILATILRYGDALEERVQAITALVNADNETILQVAQRAHNETMLEALSSALGIQPVPADQPDDEVPDIKGSGLKDYFTVKNAVITALLAVAGNYAYKQWFKKAAEAA